MKSFLKNPLTSWFRWYLRTLKIEKSNKGKFLKIGYMTTVHNVQFGLYNTLYDFVTIANSKIGDYVYITSGGKITNTEIGKFCSIGPNVTIGLPMHPTNLISTFPAFFSIRKQCQETFADKNYFEETGKVIIGNDVWIGANSIIMDNVKVGDGAIIGAGALVTKDVEAYSVVGGVPAKIIKYRFSKDQIESLTSFKWWDKELKWIKENYRKFNFPSEFWESNNL